MIPTPSPNPAGAGKKGPSEENNAADAPAVIAMTYTSENNPKLNFPETLKMSIIYQ
jgi:hypothetical protein